jgi:hypothetical protein
MSAALSVALSLEASPSKVVESIIDFGSDLLLDFVPLSQLLSGKAAAGAAAATGAGAMHMLTQAFDASCLGNALADSSHMLAQNAQSAAWLADSLAGLADDAIGGQVLKVIAAAGVAFAVRRALEPVAAPLSPRSAAAMQRAKQKQDAAIAPLAATMALGMLASSTANPTASKALMYTQQAPEPLTSPKAVAAAATAAAESAIKDATSWPSKLQRRAKKAAAEINEGKLSLMGVLVALDVAAVVHNAGDVAQVVQQVAGGS